jgi:beta-lactamase regulating signal transducer with metallopeptidase domain
MILSWMLYALLVSVLIAVAARGFEEVCGSARLPVRFVWVAALLATLALVALAPLRGLMPESAVTGGVVEQPVPGSAGAVESAGDAAAGSGPLGAALASVREAAAWPLRAAAPLTGVPGGRVLGIVWLAGSLGLLLVGTATALRYTASRRQWPVREIAGTPVRVSPAAGPAVLGLMRPEIVVPGWLLSASPEEQRLVVLHEREHVSARDPLALTAGWLVVALVPWNPVLWWLLWRMRLAVELDCDARVLRAGVGRQAYGSVLIEMAGRGSGLPLGAPALAGTPSNLERRLVAMTTTRRSTRARPIALGALGAVALLAACETRMPTAVEIAEMDVAAVEAQAELWQLVNPSTERIAFFIDGVQVTPEKARRLAVEEIAELEVVRATDEFGASIRIRGHDGSTAVRARHLELVSPTPGERRDLVALRAADRAAESEQVLVGAHEDKIIIAPMSGFTGLLVIDGVESDVKAMEMLRPAQIANVEVLKGPAAVRAYSHPRAEHGVIRITTRK